MWSRLDDALIDHEKVFAAGAHLGKNGPAIAIGFFAVAIMWCNKHLTDGFLPRDVVKGLPHVEKPLAVADALARATLLDRGTKNGKRGFLVHDFGEYNEPATRVRKHRRNERLRKQRERARKRGKANGGTA